MAKDLVIYMATHNQKCSHVLKYDYITPIQVGKALNDLCVENVTDDTGDNISEKNKTYCELTALYWIWKNTHEKYVGLYHYRRRLDIQKQNILKILNYSDVILPKKKKFKISIKEQYIREHSLEDWNILMEELKQLYPEYFDFAEKIFDKNEIYRFNMFIMKKNMFDEYCQWLFPLLEKVDKRIDVEKKDSYQIRYAGFMSERLFTLYIAYNQFKTYEADVIFGEKKVKEDIKNIASNCIFKFRSLVRK